MKAFVAVALVCVAVVAGIEEEGYAFDVKHDFYGGIGGGGIDGGFGGGEGGFGGIGGGQGGGFGGGFGGIGGGQGGGFGGGQGGGFEGGYHFPAYKYAYGVKDHHTGDFKDAWEHRHGDHVEGEYSFKEADGTHRIVKYHANGKEGFNAIVKNIGKASEGGFGGQGGQGGFGGGIGGGYGKGYSYQKVKYL